MSICGKEHPGKVCPNIKQKIKAGSVVRISGTTFRSLAPKRRYTVKSVNGKYAFIRGLGWGLKTALILVKP